MNRALNIINNNGWKVYTGKKTEIISRYIKKILEKAGKRNDELEDRIQRNI